jgi:hypothetical protein
MLQTERGESREECEGLTASLSEAAAPVAGVIVALSNTRERDASAVACRLSLSRHRRSLA